MDQMTLRIDWGRGEGEGLNDGGLRQRLALRVDGNVTMEVFDDLK